MKKGNSNTKPKRIEKLGNKFQFRWNITRNDRTDEDGNTTESWDYNYANCNGNGYADLVSGIIRSRYDENEAEAIMANYQQGRDIEKYIEFQAWRKQAKAIARNEPYDETELYKQATEEAVDNAAMKRLLRKVAAPVLADETTLTEQDIEDVKMLYRQWRVGVDYEVDKKLMYNDELYKVISAHTSQSDWTPDVANTLFNKYKPADVISEWDYPVEYELEKKVTYNGATYRCIQPHTSQSDWTPDAVPSLWEVV
jgi:hypothetical protein